MVPADRHDQSVLRHLPEGAVHAREEVALGPGVPVVGTDVRAFDVEKHHVRVREGVQGRGHLAVDVRAGEACEAWVGTYLESKQTGQADHRPLAGHDRRAKLVPMKRTAQTRGDSGPPRDESVGRRLSARPPCFVHRMVLEDMMTSRQETVHRIGCPPGVRVTWGEGLARQDVRPWAGPLWIGVADPG